MSQPVPQRFLRPGYVISLDSGLWVVDEFQPAAAVLDPTSGDVRRVVSWPSLPPAPSDVAWPGPAVVGDGHGLWVQQDRAGPLLRIDADGVRDAVWTDGMLLAAAGGGEAWCVMAPPGQQFVSDPAAELSMPQVEHWILRVRGGGSCEVHLIDRAVRGALSTPEALVLCVDDAPGQVQTIGPDTWFVSWTTRYLVIPWGTALPDRIVVDHWPNTSTQRPAGALRVPNMTWHHDEEARQLFPAAGMSWRIGRDPQSRGQVPFPLARVIASAVDHRGRLVQRFDLGVGDAVTIAGIPGDRAVAVAVRRSGSTRPVELMALHPEDGHVTTLLAADAVDITAHCWPLIPRPVETDSYEAQVLARNSALEAYWHSEAGVTPLAEGMSDVTTHLDGQWPRTRLEWTFRWSRRPGLRLRRTTLIYDELGRIGPPGHADINLAEHLESGWVPPASAASNGILDV